MKPESPLPWRLFDESVYEPDHRMILAPELLENGENDNIGRMWKASDAEYVIHACNWYPRLIYLLKTLNTGDYPLAREVVALLKDLGEL